MRSPRPRRRECCQQPPLSFMGVSLVRVLSRTPFPLSRGPCDVKKHILSVIPDGLALCVAVDTISSS